MDTRIKDKLGEIFAEAVMLGHPGGVITEARPGSFWECPELCVSGPVHAVSDTQASKRSPNIMANWLRAANHSRTFRPSFSKLRMAR